MKPEAWAMELADELELQPPSAGLRAATAVRSGLRLRLLQLAGCVRRPRPWPANPSRILIIRPDHLGDLLMAAPALAVIRGAFPESQIDGWVGPWGVPAWRGNKHLNVLCVCEFPGFTRSPGPHVLAPYQLMLAEAARLRGAFDIAINLRDDFWWGALAAAWARIPVAGYAVPECEPFLSLAVAHGGKRHEVERNVDLARAVAQACGRRDDRDESAAFGPATKSPARPAMTFDGGAPPEGIPAGAIAIHPGAGADVKLWEERSWATVAEGLAGEGPIVLTAGNAEEHLLAQRIAAAMRCPSLVSQGLDLQQLGGLYRQCRLVLGVDSGPLHLARAVGTPTVTLFGPTDPEKFGPFPQDSPRHAVVRLAWRCIPCGRLDYNQTELRQHPCVRLIHPQHVLQAARQVLQASAYEPLESTPTLA